MLSGNCHKYYAPINRVLMSSWRLVGELVSRVEPPSLFNCVRGVEGFKLSFHQRDREVPYFRWESTLSSLRFIWFFLKWESWFNYNVCQIKCSCFIHFFSSLIIFFCFIIFFSSIISPLLLFFLLFSHFFSSYFFFSSLIISCSSLKNVHFISFPHLSFSPH